MDDDEFGTDADFLAALAVSEASIARAPIQQPTPQRITPSSTTTPQAPHQSNASNKIVQPTPQALPTRSSGSSILVSPRQKGNPILTQLRSLPWEYSDIIPDYILGNTTCALFLSLKYHRLHPEYIYNRIRSLQGKYQLRILLTMVDIGNHEDSIRELSKTSLINEVTVILTWSAGEAGRYLELFKSFEGRKGGEGIRGAGPRNTWAEKMVEFVTVPRSVNRTDAVSLVSAFGSVRGAVNARPEEVAVLSGFGEKKVRKWCEVVQEPFRARKAARRTVGDKEGERGREVLESALPLSRVPAREMASLKAGLPVESGRGSISVARNDNGDKTLEPFQLWEPGDDEDDEEAIAIAAVEEEQRKNREKKMQTAQRDDTLSDGIAAALAKLRES